VNTKSAKAKGRRLQDRVRLDLIESLDIDPDIIRCAVMGETGADIKVSHPAWPVDIECGNQERVNLWAKWEQALTRATKNEKVALLVLAKNRTEPVVVMRWAVALEFFKEWLKEFRRVRAAGESQTQ
jgi:hypothetical protein